MIWWSCRAKPLWTIKVVFTPAFYPLIFFHLVRRGGAAQRSPVCQLHSINQHIGAVRKWNVHIAHQSRRSQSTLRENGRISEVLQPNRDAPQPLLPDPLDKITAWGQNNNFQVILVLPGNFFSNVRVCIKFQQRGDISAFPFLALNTFTLEHWATVEIPWLLFLICINIFSFINSEWQQKLLTSWQNLVEIVLNNHIMKQTDICSDLWHLRISVSHLDVNFLSERSRSSSLWSWLRLNQWNNAMSVTCSRWNFQKRFAKMYLLPKLLWIGCVQSPESKSTAG